MTSDQIAQAKVDIDVALRLIELGHLEPAQEVLRFAIAELNDAGRLCRRFSGQRLPSSS